MLSSPYFLNFFIIIFFYCLDRMPKEIDLRFVATVTTMHSRCELLRRMACFQFFRCLTMKLASKKVSCAVGIKEILILRSGLGC